MTDPMRSPPPGEEGAVAHALHGGIREIRHGRVHLVRDLASPPPVASVTERAVFLEVVGPRAPRIAVRRIRIPLGPHVARNGEHDESAGDRRLERSGRAIGDEAVAAQEEPACRERGSQHDRCDDEETKWPHTE